MAEGELLPKGHGKGMGLDAPGKQEIRAKLQKALVEQHPLHAYFGTAFEEVGGIERLIEWANDNYDDFIKVFTRMMPTGGTHGSGKVQIQINNQLQPTKLDE